MAKADLTVMASLLGGHVTRVEASIGPAVIGIGDGFMEAPSQSAHPYLIHPRLLIEGEHPPQRLLIGGDDLLPSPRGQVRIIQWPPDPMQLGDQLGPALGEGMGGG
jgi:hypothetical protein